MNHEISPRVIQTRVTQSEGVRSTDEIYFLVNVFHTHLRRPPECDRKNDERCPRDKSVTDDRRHFLRNTFQTIDAKLFAAGYLNSDNNSATTANDKDLGTNYNVGFTFRNKSHLAQIAAVIKERIRGTGNSYNIVCEQS